MTSGTTFTGELKEAGKHTWAAAKKTTEAPKALYQKKGPIAVLAITFLAGAWYASPEKSEGQIRAEITAEEAAREWQHQKEQEAARGFSYYFSKEQTVGQDDMCHAREMADKNGTVYVVLPADIAASLNPQALKSGLQSIDKGTQYFGGEKVNGRDANCHQLVAFPLPAVNNMPVDTLSAYAADADGVFDGNKHYKGKSATLVLRNNKGCPANHVYVRDDGLNRCFKDGVGRAGYTQSPNRTSYTGFSALSEGKGNKGQYETPEELRNALSRGDFYPTQ